MLTNMTHTTILLIAPRALNQFQRYSEHSENRIIAFFHQTLMEQRNRIVLMIGERNWSMINKVVVDNAWISHFFLTQVLGLFISNKFIGNVPIIPQFIGLCLLSWGVQKCGMFVIQQIMKIHKCQKTENKEIEKNSMKYENDPILSKWICPITLIPTQDIVGDPTNGGKTIYDSKALAVWLKDHSTSPVTRQPITSEPIRYRYLSAFLKHRAKQLDKQQELTQQSNS